MAAVARCGFSVKMKLLQVSVVFDGEVLGDGLDRWWMFSLDGRWLCTFLYRGADTTYDIHRRPLTDDDGPRGGGYIESNCTKSIQRSGLLKVVWIQRKVRVWDEFHRAQGHSPRARVASLSLPEATRVVVEEGKYMQRQQLRLTDC